MKKCFRCDEPLNDTNRSSEHIILNACGGVLKSSELLCNVCNPIYGTEFDSALAESTSVICTMLMIEKESGKLQNIKAVSESGEQYYLLPGNIPVKTKPTIEKTQEGDRVNLHISASNEKQYREIVKGHLRKYPQLKKVNFYEQRSVTDNYLGESLNVKMSLGGPLVFKSILKTAIEFYLINGGERSTIIHLLPYLEKEFTKAPNKVVWLHYPDIPVHHCSVDEVSHVLYLNGNPDELMLYAYVELFNCHSFVIKLNDNYTGPKLEASYCYELLQKRIIPASISHKYQRAEVLELFTVRDFIERRPQPFYNAQERMQRVMRIADARNEKLQIKRMTDKILATAFSKYPLSMGNSPERDQYISELSKIEVTRYVSSRKRTRKDEKA